MADVRMARRAMVDQIQAMGVTNRRVLAAMRKVPREAFVPAAQQDNAHADKALPLAEGQTISQPYIVALMLEAIAPRPGHNVLEIGTGSGYVAALLAELVRSVVTIERREGLATSARARLAGLGYGSVRVIAGDGTLGYPDAAPYDGIIVSAFGPDVPDALREQLAIGGRLAMPVGSSGAAQRLVRVTRQGAETYATDDLGAVQFVPLIGAQGWPPQPD